MNRTEAGKHIVPERNILWKDLLWLRPRGRCSNATQWQCAESARCAVSLNVLSLWLMGAIDACYCPLAVICSSPQLNGIVQSFNLCGVNSIAQQAVRVGKWMKWKGKGREGMAVCHSALLQQAECAFSHVRSVRTYHAMFLAMCGLFVHTTPCF